MRLFYANWLLAPQLTQSKSQKDWKDCLRPARSLSLLSAPPSPTSHAGLPVPSATTLLPQLLQDSFLLKSRFRRQLLSDTLPYPPSSVTETLHPHPSLSPQPIFLLLHLSTHHCLRAWTFLLTALSPHNTSYTAVLKGQTSVCLTSIYRKWQTVTKLKTLSGGADTSTSQRPKARLWHSAAGSGTALLALAQCCHFKQLVRETGILPPEQKGSARGVASSHCQPEAETWWWRHHRCSG